MSRRVYSATDLEVDKNLKTKAEKQELYDKVLKYIPAEIVTAWTALNGILATLGSDVYWGVCIFLGILVPIYIWRTTSEGNLSAAYWQIGGATGAYIVWVFSMGGPFTTLTWFDYKPEYGTIALVIYSVILVIMLQKKPTS